MKLSFHTSQQESPGYTSLQLDIAYTDGLLNEKEISNACELAISTFVSHIAQSIVGKHSQEQVDRRRQVSAKAPQRNQMDQILEQILCEGSNLSTV